MERQDATGTEEDASVPRSWASSSGEVRATRSRDPSPIDRSRFGFRSMSRSDATSAGSDVPARFAGFQRSREGSEDHAHSHSEEEYAGGLRGEEEDQEEEEEEEEEEEDDDDVRRSWTTEKEPAPDRFGRAIDLTSFRFRHEQVSELEEEEDEEERDSDASFASLEWVTRQLRQLERRQRRSSSGDAAQADERDREEEDDEDDVNHSMDAHVRDALHLLNGQGDDHQQHLHGHGENSWAQSAAERRGSYFDIVQEAMAVEWRREAEDQGHQSDHVEGQDEEEEEDEEHDEDEVVQEGSQESAVPEDTPDEWLEAFTAKGRVYYYNRRTRESSWTKPESIERSEHHDGSMKDQQLPEHEEEEDHDSDREKQHQQQSVDYHSDHGSGQSSTSSTSSTNQDQEREPSSRPSDLNSRNVLFCCFCGSQVDGAGGFQAHFNACATLQHHKQSASPLYTQFQQMLVVLSEDVSLRSLHYASAFPDAKPHPIGVEPPAQTQQSVRESLTLLRVKHRSNRKPVVHRVAPDYEDRVPSFQPAKRLSLPSSTSSKNSTKTPPREPLVNRYASIKQKPTPVALLNMETCRHCGRSFAEGRLAKHEAVCPRVFGNEHAWGRGPSVSVQKKSSVTEADQGYNQSRPDSMLGLLKKKHHANLKHTLALSFQEHQASLVECPCCRRKFAPSGAQQHIDICRTVQHRPRNPVPLLKDYALAG